MKILNWLAKINYWYDQQKKSDRLILMLIILFGPWFLYMMITSMLGLEYSVLYPILWMCFPGCLRIFWVEGNLKKYL
jgi:uncharacterized membrane protein